MIHDKRVYVVCMASLGKWALNRGYEYLGEVQDVSQYINHKATIHEVDNWIPTWQRPAWAEYLTEKDVLSVWVEPATKYRG